MVVGDSFKSWWYSWTGSWDPLAPPRPKDGRWKSMAVIVSSTILSRIETARHGVVAVTYLSRLVLSTVASNHFFHLP